MKEKRSLKKDTLVLFIILLLFFCLVFALAAYIVGDNASRDYRIRTAETAVQNVERTIYTNLVNYNYLTRLLMVDESIVTYLKADEITQDMLYEARKGIYSIQNLYSYIDSVFVFRLDGQSASTERSPYYIDEHGEEYERIMAARGSTIVAINGNGMIHKATGETMMTLSRAIYDINSQKLLGFLIMNVASSYFDSSLTNEMEEEICVVDNMGTLLCGDASLSELYNPNKLPDDEGLITNEVQINGKNKILAASNALEPFTIMCASGKSPRVLSVQLIVALVLTLAAFLCAIFVWGYYVSTNIVSPIHKLRTAMETTKSSGWLSPIETEMPGNEVGMLAENYNSLIEYLNEMFARQIENEKSIQKAEMRVLQEQIKPHFLYNTLETISYLAIEEHAPNVHDALESLGSFYRNFLSKGDREIPLRIEIRIIQDYLALQKLRYGEAFDAEYDVDPDTLECIIPKLILQPLVENAIYHGVRPKGEGEKIRITTKREAEYLLIQVYDSGVGMDEAQIQAVLSDQSYGDEKSFGLAGTIHRIRYFCNSQDVVTIRSEIGEYSEVEIRIPMSWETNEGVPNV